MGEAGLQPAPASAHASPCEAACLLQERRLTLYFTLTISGRAQYPYPPSATQKSADCKSSVRDEHPTNAW